MREDEDTFDFEAAAREEQERVRWRNRTRAEAGFSPYVVDPDPARRFQFAPTPLPTRATVVKALARAATFCRAIPEASPHLKRRLMHQALDRAESQMVTRLKMLRRRWIMAGCPPGWTPWRMVASREEVVS